MTNDTLTNDNPANDKSACENEASMDSDGTLATVTYLPGVSPHSGSVHDHAAVPQETAVLAESTAPFEEATPSPRVLRRAENVSMNALTRRGRSRWELGKLLASRELDSSVIEAELDRLESVGLIDDGALAETIVRTQHERKGLGRAALANELRKKRIDQSTIDAALEQIGADDELGRALQLAERRANQLRELDHNTAVRRLSGYLQRKGYSGETVRQVIREVLPTRPSGVSFS